MEHHDTFVFESSELDHASGRIELRYSLDGRVRFTETLELPRYGRAKAPIDREEAIGRALHALHLFGGTSYYKTCCPRTIEVRSGALSKGEAEFWNTVYEKGLGEFFFRNNMDPRGLINFPHGKQGAGRSISPGPSPTLSPRLLVPIGGGKDSIVTAELLKAGGYDVTLLRMGRHPLIEETARLAGLPLLTIERHLSGTLFDLNAEGALNGHVPITGYLSALAVLTALLYGFDAVVMSNERSASEGNVQYLGTEINHQWSKSLEFERMFQRYLADFVTEDVQYASLLRPWSELKIAETFCRFRQYFPVATSCNANWRILRERPKERWCGACPKCAFAFALFAAFLPEEQLLAIFGDNLFEAQTLLPLYRQLLGLEGFKPFECVGTPAETQAAFLLARKRGNFAESAAMRMFEEEALPAIREPEELIRRTLSPSDEHALPAPLLALLS